MLIELVNFLVTLVLLALVAWCTLSIASVRFRRLSRARRWYSRFLWRCLTFLFWKVPASITRWLFKAPSRSGPAHMSNPPRIQGQEDERWG